MGQGTENSTSTGHAGSTDRVEVTDLGDGSPSATADRPPVPNRRPNPFFAAAWILTILMIGLGLLLPLLITGAGARYADYLPDGTTSMASMYFLTNLLQAGPSLFVSGCVAAVALLTIHGIRRRDPA